MAANVILFIPFGAFVGTLAPAWKWWKLLALFAGASLIFEVVQYVLAIGSGDITDVIDNTFGGMIGLGLLMLTRRRAGERADTIAQRILVIGTGILVLAVMLFLLSPLRFHAPRV